MRIVALILIVILFILDFSGCKDDDNELPICTECEPFIGKYLLKQNDLWGTGDWHSVPYEAVDSGYIKLDEYGRLNFYQVGQYYISDGSPITYYTWENTYRYEIITDSSLEATIPNWSVDTVFFFPHLDSIGVRIDSIIFRNGRYSR